MRIGCRFLNCGLSVVLLILVSCERTPQEGGPFNQPLGGARALAPTPAPVIDVGILADQSTYQPARSGPAEPGAVQTAGGEEGEQEQEAIRARVREIVQAAISRNVEALFDAFVQEQIAVVLPLKSTVIETVEKLEAMQRQLAQLGGPAAQPDEGQAALLEAIGGKLLDAFTGALAVEMLSADQAAVRVDAARFQENLTPLVPEIQRALEQMAAAGGGLGGAQGPSQLPPEVLERLEQEMAAAGTPSPPTLEQQIADAVQQLAGYTLSMSRVEEVWRIALPLTLTEAHAEIGRDGLGLLNEYLDKVMERLQSLESADQAAISSLFMQVAFEVLPRLMELMQKVEALQASASPADGPDSSAPQPEGEDEDSGEDQEAPGGSPRGGRSPRSP